MANIVVFVVVSEVRVEIIVFEGDVSIGIRGERPSCLHIVEHVHAEDFRLRSLFLGDGHGPVVAVVADGANNSFLGDDLENAGEIGDEPILPCYGAGIALGFVLVVIHQQDGVTVGG